MNLRQIKYFCKVVESGSGNAAAKLLCVAPTAISTQLGLLEENLGGELFDRSKRPMQLTSLGQFFYPRAKELLLQAQRLEEESNRVAIGNGGWLGVGFIRSTLFSLLPDVIRHFREAHPDVHLDLIEKLSEYQVESLLQRRIDIGISRFIGEFERHPDMDYRLIFDDPLLAVLPASHPLAKQTSFSLKNFHHLPFILYPKDARSPYGEKLQAYLREKGVTPTIHHEAIEIHTAFALVGAGLGGTLVSRSMTDNNRQDVVFLPVEDIEISTSLVAVTRKGGQNKLLDNFIEILMSKGKLAQSTWAGQDYQASPRQRQP
ncbi:LysR family transcriptional regulator [Stutzerimonas stutzeri]|uniref:LysR family transcriptional regulator n=1 Tax=Stutzerimonas stutzeri TaxID=316 RepID=UPI00374509FF